MIDELFDKKLEKQLDKIAKEKAGLKAKEEEATKQAMSAIDPETIRQILDKVEFEGHPSEQKKCQFLRAKYEEENWEFDELMAFRTLYRSNWRKFQNKGDQHE